jgi:hypothetical protein
MRELRPQSPSSTPRTPAAEEEHKPPVPSPVSVSPWSRFMHPAPKSAKTKHVELELEGVMNLVYDCYEKKVKVGVRVWVCACVYIWLYECVAWLWSVCVVRISFRKCMCVCVCVAWLWSVCVVRVSFHV